MTKLHPQDRNARQEKLTYLSVHALLQTINHGSEDSSQGVTLQESQAMMHDKDASAASA